MSSTERVRTRAQRVASRIDYNGFLERFKKIICNDDGLKKLGIVFAASLIVTIICGAWDQPLKFKLFSAPDRDIICNTPFSSINARQTAENKSIALKNSPHYYVNDPSKLTAYKQMLLQEMQIIVGMNDRPTPDERKTLRCYLSSHPTPEEERQTLERLQNYFEEDVELKNYQKILNDAFSIYEADGVIKDLHTPNAGNQEMIKVYNIANAKKLDLEKALPLLGASARSCEEENEDKEKKIESFTEMVDRELGVKNVRTPEVLFGNGLALKTRLNTEFHHDQVAELILERIRKRPPVTLTEDVANTKYAQAEAVSKVGDVYQNFVVGEPIVPANERIGNVEYEWLREERASYLRSRLPISRFIRFFATFTLNTLLLLSAYFIVVARRLAVNATIDEHQTAREVLGFMGFLVVFFLVGRSIQVFWPNKGTLVELAPVVIFVELTTFAISLGVALTVGVLLSLMLTISSGGGLEIFVPLCGTSVFVAFMARSVRTRFQLAFLAVDTAVCAFMLSLATSVVSNDSMRPTIGDGELKYVFNDLKYSCMIALSHGLWAFLGGALTTCLLPVVELYFHVVTPMQLLEYTNPSHPLMIELNQRAPATYNHSLQTSYLAEAAAEAIGARSYLVKVGAYFHDVGKMMKPEYFTENQNGYNIHDELEPRMSALVIVAHVKDGVNLGIKYRLPREIVDLIQQHHGTMLVSFFYQRALKAAQEEDPDARLDEAPFRYPGPIPQTKEAGILMLADAVESASRSLTDWAPRRVENLVRKITEMRIEDGQFQDSGLTFGEVQTIQQSLVTSLLASRHSRVKYPDADNDKEQKENSQIAHADGSQTVKTSDSKVARGDGSQIVKTSDSKVARGDGSQIVKTSDSKVARGDGSQIVKSPRVKTDGSSIADASAIIKTPH